MWFARLFGGRGGQDDEQPTATPPPRPEVPLDAATKTAKPAVKRRTHDGQRKGFDPYNSGAFQRHVWERINRD